MAGSSGAGVVDGAGSTIGFGSLVEHEVSIKHRTKKEIYFMRTSIKYQNDIIRNFSRFE
jgi:hypothetical protein